jgi:hypothetical protein
MMNHQERKDFGTLGQIKKMHLPPKRSGLTAEMLVDDEAKVRSLIFLHSRIRLELACSQIFANLLLW